MLWDFGVRFGLTELLLLVATSAFAAYRTARFSRWVLSALLAFGYLVIMLAGSWVYVTSPPTILHKSLLAGPDAHIIVVLRLGAMGFLVGYLMTNEYRPIWFRVLCAGVLGFASVGFVWGVLQIAVELRVWPSIAVAFVRQGDVYVPELLLRLAEAVRRALMMGAISGVCGMAVWIGWVFAGLREKVQFLGKQHRNLAA